MNVIKFSAPEMKTDLSNVQPGDIFAMDGKVYRGFADGRTGKTRACLIANSILEYQTLDPAQAPRVTRERAGGVPATCCRCGRTRPTGVMVRTLDGGPHCDRDPLCIRLVQGDVLN